MRAYRTHQGRQEYERYLKNSEFGKSNFPDVSELEFNNKDRHERFRAMEKNGKTEMLMERNGKEFYELVFRTISEVAPKKGLYTTLVVCMVNGGVDMGKITVSVEDNIEEEFRRLVAQKYGARKGALGAAMTEAMRMWIAKTKAELREWEG